MAIAGGGFTFVPRTDIRGIESQQMIFELFTNRTQVLMRIQKKDGTQPYTLVQQLPEYKQRFVLTFTWQFFAFARNYSP